MPRLSSVGALDAYLSDVAAEVLVAQLSDGNASADQARKTLARVDKEIPTLALELCYTPAR